MSLSDDELKKLRDSDEIISQQEAMRIIDEALSRGARLDGMATELERKSKDLRAWEVDARTTQARLKELEAGTTLTQAQTDIVTKAMRESQPADPLARLKEDVLRAARKVWRTTGNNTDPKWLRAVHELEGAVERLERKRR